MRLFLVRNRDNGLIKQNVVFITVMVIIYTFIIFSIYNIVHITSDQKMEPLDLLIFHVESANWSPMVVVSNVTLDVLFKKLPKAPF